MSQRKKASASQPPIKTEKGINSLCERKVDPNIINLVQDDADDCQSISVTVNISSDSE